MLNYRGGERVNALGLIINTSSPVPSAPFPPPLCLGRTSFQDKPGDTRAFSWQTLPQKAFPTFWDEYFRSRFLSSDLHSFLPTFSLLMTALNLIGRRRTSKIFLKNCFHIKRFEVLQFASTRTSCQTPSHSGSSGDARCLGGLLKTEKSILCF